MTPFAFASGRDRQAIADELDAYNAAARACCTAEGVAFVDITGISRLDAGDGADATAMLADDGLHPSETSQRRLAKIIAGVLTPPLVRPKSEL